MDTDFSLNFEAKAYIVQILLSDHILYIKDGCRLREISTLSNFNRIGFL